MTVRSIAQSLAAIAVEAPNEDAAPAAHDAATLCILDAVGNALGAVRRAEGVPLKDWLARESVGDAFVLGEDIPRTPAVAALANGFLMHVEDYDDSPHSTYFLPALLAESTRSQVTGQSFVSAWIAAYEVWMLLVTAARIDRPFNPTSVIAPIAAAAGVSRLRGLDQVTATTALALAGQSSGGIRAGFGTHLKALDAGRSSASGLTAVDLAENGWTAEPEIFDAPNGWIAAFGTFDGARERFDAGLEADPARFPRVGRAPLLKRWPCCARHIGPLDALFAALADTDGKPVTALRVEIGFRPAATAVFREEPCTPMEARFSLPYVLTAAAVDGEISPRTFTPSSFVRIMGHPLREAIDVAYRPERAGTMDTETCLVEITTEGGDRRTVESVGLGAPTRDEVVTKFHSNAGSAPTADAAERILAIGDCDDVGALWREINTSFLAARETPLPPRDQERTS